MRISIQAVATVGRAQCPARARAQQKPDTARYSEKAPADGHAPTTGHGATRISLPTRSGASVPPSWRTGTTVRRPSRSQDATPDSVKKRSSRSECARKLPGALESRSENRRPAYLPHTRRALGQRGQHDRQRMNSPAIHAQEHGGPEPPAQVPHAVSSRTVQHSSIWDGVWRVWSSDRIFTSSLLRGK